MLRKVKTVLSRLKTRSADGVADAWPHGQPSVNGDGRAADGTTVDGTDAASPPHLYECPSCDQVYVAIDKSTCSTCETAVGRVE
jgi:hypothetical protein